MGDSAIISGLQAKRSSVAGLIIDLRRQIDKLQADLFHVDAVLRLYDVEPIEIPPRAECQSARLISGAARYLGAATTISVNTETQKLKILPSLPCRTKEWTL